MKSKYAQGSSAEAGHRCQRLVNRENRARHSGSGSQTSITCPAMPRAVMASRLERLDPSDTKTRLGENTIDPENPSRSPRGSLFGFELSLADKFRGQHHVLDARAKDPK